QLGLERLLEARAVRGGELPAAPPVAGEREEGGAVEALERLLHLLAGEDALVVLPQDDVDRAAQAVEEGDRVEAAGQEDGEEAAEAQGELRPQAEEARRRAAGAAGLRRGSGRHGRSFRRSRRAIGFRVESAGHTGSGGGQATPSAWSARPRIARPASAAAAPP